MLGFRAGLEQHGLPLPEFEKPFHLLPLLRPLPGAPFASAPPEAELAYFESHRPARISFRADGVDWIATTHVLPAAYPRMHDDSVSPPSDPVHPLGKGAERAGATPAEIREAQWSLLDEHVQAHPPPTYYPPHSALDAELDAEKRRAARYPQLWTVVERIVPMRSAEEQEALDVQGSTGLTFVATHANGFHKETYEPLYQHLAETLAERRKADPTAPHVDELWSIDSVDSGDAGLLNQHSLGQCISWLDEPRDILNFLRFYLPKASASIADEGRKGGQVPQAQAGKNHTGRRGLKAGASGRANAELKPSWPARQLPRLHADEGLQGRKVVLLGHSRGGCALATLSALEPTLVEHTILIDPVILQSERWEDGFVGGWPPLHILGRGAAIRQEVWPSADNALTSFRKKPYFAAWDPRALDLYVRFALLPLHPNPTPSGSGGPRRLAMSKWREAEAFGANWMSRYTWALLERSRNTAEEDGGGRTPIQVLTMEGSIERGIYCEERETEAKLRDLISSQTRRSSAKQIQAQHLIVQHKPAQLATEIAEILVPIAPSAAQPPKARL